MFNAQSHVAFGFIVLVIVHLFGLAVSSVDIVCGLFGSLLPDIDHRRSTLGRFNPFARFMRHRGKCHTILGSFGLSVPFYLLGGTTGALFAFVGCMSHLFADKLYSIFPKKRAFTIRIW